MGHGDCCSGQIVETDSRFPTLVAKTKARQGWGTELRVIEEVAVEVKEKLSSLGAPVPELPVLDVERAQQYYRDVLGFEIGWLYPGKGIGAVSRGRVAIFFRKRELPFEPAIHWVFAEDIDATYQELQALGAQIVEPLEVKPWGLRQFTVKDLDGNLFYIHHG
jgi:catechol 2,3-dioxygenase-like lactoylglutathione lyase family enzyme